MVSLFQNQVDQMRKKREEQLKHMEQQIEGFRLLLEFKDDKLHKSLPLEFKTQQMVHQSCLAMKKEMETNDPTNDEQNQFIGKYLKNDI